VPVNPHAEEVGIAWVCLCSCRHSVVLSWYLERVNDHWGGRGVTDIVGNLSQMVHSVQAADARPLLLTVLPVDRPVFAGAQTRVQAIDAAIRAMAKHHGVTVVDAASVFQRHRPLSALLRPADGRDDGVHPNDAGYQLLAQMVALALQLRSATLD